MNSIKPATATTEQVRILFPDCIAFADECRKVFGTSIRLVYARQGNNEIGQMSSVADKSISLSQMMISPTTDEDADEE